MIEKAIIFAAGMLLGNKEGRLLINNALLMVNDSFKDYNSKKKKDNKKEESEDN